MAESAVGSNYAVTALDSYGDQDLRALTRTYSLRREFGVPYTPRALYEAGCQLDCVRIAYTSNLENHPEILDLFAAAHCVIGNSSPAIRSVRNWSNLFSRLGKSGFPVPEIIYPGEHGKPGHRYQWLVKPVLSGGGHGISFFQGTDFSGTHSMLQQYFPGKSCSAAFVSNGQKSVVIGISEQLIGMREFGATDFRYCGSILPLREALEPGAGESVVEQVRRLAVFLTREFGLKGVNGFDFILNKGQVCLIEVNPRYTASMELIERAYGLPIFDLHVQAAMEQRLPEFNLESLLNSETFFGKSILFSRKDSIVPDRLNWEGLDARDIPAPGEELLAGRPVCTFLACRATYEKTVAELIRRAGILEEQIHG